MDEGGVLSRCLSIYCHLQVELFENIKPLFANKPLLVCVNKIDVTRLSELTEDRQVRLDTYSQYNAPL